MQLFHKQTRKSHTFAFRCALVHMHTNTHLLEEVEAEVRRRRGVADDVEGRDGGDVT